MFFRLLGAIGTTQAACGVGMNLRRRLKIRIGCVVDLREDQRGCLIPSVGGREPHQATFPRNGITGFFRHPIHCSEAVRQVIGSDAHRQHVCQQSGPHALRRIVDRLPHVLNEFVPNVFGIITNFENHQHRVEACRDVRFWVQLAEPCPPTRDHIILAKHGLSQGLPALLILPCPLQCHPPSEFGRLIRHFAATEKIADKPIE